MAIAQINMLVKMFENSGEFIKRHPITRFPSREALFDYSLSNVNVEGLYMEFGVYMGVSINYLASKIGDKTIYGFDSFEGLPEDFNVQRKKGTFKLDHLPKVADNVQLVVGYFQDTLKPFLDKHSDKVAFIHLDADLYLSTKSVLFTLVEYGRFQMGTVIQFDELFLNIDRKWCKGEFYAFREFVNTSGIKFKWLGFSGPQCSLILV